MTKVLGMGNALVDIMTRLDNESYLELFELPKGSMILVDRDRSDRVMKGTTHLEKIMASGGSAANTIHGLARLGIETAFVGKIGHDEIGEIFRQDLLKSGIKPLLSYSDTESGRAVALVSPDAERTFATYLGAAVELSDTDLSASLFPGYDYFHIEGYLVQNHKLLERAVELARQGGLKISLDMASYNVVEENLDFLKRIVKDYIDIVFANEEEARVFTGQGPEKALDIIARDCDIAVVKTGSKGSLIRHGDDVFKIGIIPVRNIDSTGAGDLYASGFIYGLAKGLTLAECGRIGSVLAGKVLEVMGPKLDEKGWEEAVRLIS